MHLRDLQPASFRGVRFLVPKDTAEEGRNSIRHRFPDANFQYVEDNGYLPPDFKVTAILHGDNLPAKVRALRNALNTPGPATLKHPYYGAHLCAVMGPYHVNRTDEDSGVITLEITFAVTGGALFPGLVSGIPAVVSGLASSAIGSILSLLPDLFGTGAMSEFSRTEIGDSIAALGTVIEQQFPATIDSSRMISLAPNLADDGARVAKLLTAALLAPPAASESDISATRMATGYREIFDAASSPILKAFALAVPADERGVFMSLRLDLPTDDPRFTSLVEMIWDTEEVLLWDDGSRVGWD